MDTWFANGHPTKKTDIPFPVDLSHKEDLSQFPTWPTNNLTLYESIYHGSFNHTIEKLLHVEQWTHPNIPYSFTLLACFTKKPNKPAFLTLEKPMRCLHTHIHEPIFYPRCLLGPKHPNHYKFSPKQSSTYSLSSSYA